MLIGQLNDLQHLEWRLWNAKIRPASVLNLGDESFLWTMKMAQFDLTNKDGANGGIGQSLRDKCDLDNTEVHDRALCRGPVLVALDPTHLLLAGEHDNYTRVLLPCHLPEILKCRWQGSLGGNVRLVAEWWFKVRGVDVVVVSFLTLCNLDSGMVVGPDVVVSVLQSLFNACSNAEDGGSARSHRLWEHQ